MSFLVTLLASLVFVVSCAEKKRSASENGNPPPVRYSKDMTRPAVSEPQEAVFEKEANSSKPLRYRKIDDLRVSASGAISQKALRDIRQPSKKIKFDLIVFDLRQEPHGLVNDQPIAWMAPNNFGSVDLTLDEAIRRERRLLGDLQIGEKILNTTIKSIETEESMIRTSGHQYLRFAVTEHLRPVDSEVDRFVEKMATLPEKTWVHLHDRTGEGRSSMFMLMYDFLVSARYLSFEEILEKHRKLGSVDLMKVGVDTDWNHTFKKERADFIREFYKYAKENPRGETLTWSQWLKKHP